MEIRLKECKKIRILSVFGTRPEAIKMAPIIKEFEKHDEMIISRICVTAQHRQMLDQILTLFGIAPDYDLNVMQEGQSLSQVAAAILTRLEPVLCEERPDWVLVQGDTTTVAAAALAAYFAGARVGHVEAGLRSFNKLQPFPEEVNRRLATVIADLHFAPTETARQNLLRDGVLNEAILVTGNPVIDALKMVTTLAYDDPPDGPLQYVDWQKKIIMVTAHRRENFGEPIIEICEALLEIARSCEGAVQIVYPVHLNPNIQEPVHRILGGVPNIFLTEPLDYLPMFHLMKRSTLVLTDSGGIQEEAPSLGKPVLVLREVTERPEAVEAGTARLIGAKREHIVEETLRLLNTPQEYDRMARAINPYGDGNAARRIVEAICRW